MKTLAICIPTYRRPAMLKRCIDSAIASANGRLVRIFVADDSMSKINIHVLEEIRSRFAGLVWAQNAQNYGIDLNIQRAVDMSDCDYAWLIGEDDVFLPGAVAQVHDRLQNTQAPFVFVNYQFANEDFSEIVGIALDTTEETTSIQVASFIEEQLWSVGFIGSTIVRRDAWTKTPAAPYRDTYFTHVGRVVDILSSETEVEVFAPPAIANRSQGADTFTWKHDSFGVFFGFERMCRIAASRHIGLAPSLDRALATYRHQSGYLSMKSTFRLRSQGAFDKRQFETYIRHAPIERWRKAWLAVMAYSPRLALVPFAVAYAAWHRRRRGDRSSTTRS